MGAWGSGPFENDDACDWLDELADSGVAALREALALADAADYLEAPDGSVVVAAAEVVVGLSIIMIIFRTRRSTSVDTASLLKL